MLWLRKVSVLFLRGERPVILGLEVSIHPRFARVMPAYAILTEHPIEHDFCPETTSLCTNTVAADKSDDGKRGLGTRPMASVEVIKRQCLLGVHGQFHFETLTSPLTSTSTTTFFHRRMRAHDHDRFYSIAA